ncbi:MAG: hypothetical protein M3203_00380 [Actinomycetota bacterium]|nr:hypothetical protein [Actinomycetota bacterium]
MDAYSSYILVLAEARANELRREAAEYALSRAARGSGTSWWAGLRARFGAGPRGSGHPVVPVPLPAPTQDGELRRSA